MYKILIKSITKSWKYLLILALISIPIFSQLATYPIREWDEARLTENAYEMLNNGNFITTYASGNPDLWNTKPPLMIWLQVISMKIFGVNELAIRFPSAIAALFTCLALLLFSTRYLKSLLFGFISVMILMTSWGYVAPHAIRTGDYDALLTMFTTISLLSFFMFTETRNNKYLYCFFATMAFAVLTKSVTGLIFLPAVFLYILIQKQLIPILKNKHFYFGLLGFIALVGSYYLFRELDNPGYLKAVYENELGGRYLQTLEGHSHPFDYYYNNFLNSRFKFWFWLIPFGVIFGMFNKNKNIAKLTIYVSLLSALFFIFISTAKTKLLWYDVPLYPFLSIIVAMIIFYLFGFLKDNEYINKSLRYNVAPFVLLFFFLFNPYYETVIRITTPREDKLMTQYYSIGYYLRDMISQDKRDSNEYYICYDGYFAQNSMYISLLAEQGVNVKRIHYNKLNPDNIVIASQPHIKKEIERIYEFKILDSRDNLLKYKIISRKNQ